MFKFLLSFFAVLVVSFCQAQGFTVTNYSVDITIHEEGYFDVVENYDVDFHIEKHGIFRTIQTKYDLFTFDGNETSRKIIISDIDVPGHRFEVPAKFQRNLSSDLKIKIGDPNRTIRGLQHYEIRYRVENAFLHEDERIRFYWNIKPDGWSAAFNSIEFAVHLPESISIDDEDYFLYSGRYGTTTISEDFVLTNNSSGISGRSIKGSISLPGDSVTLLMNLPANSIAEYVPFWPEWTRYLWIGILGALILAFYRVWVKYGRDDRVSATTSYYPPEGMDPAMAGFLIDDREDSIDLISLLPYWGRKGLITIEEIPRKNILVKGDTKITRIGALPADVPDYEQKLFKGLFGSSAGSEKSVLVSSLKDTFYTTLGSAKKKLKEQAQIYYVPKSTKVKWITIWILLGILIVVGLAFLFIWGILAAISLFITTLVLLILSTFLIKKNPRGNEALSELKGFKKFIAVAEERKLKMLIDEDPGYFEATMSYALAFGLFAKWGRKFEKLNTPPPNWYTSTSSRTFTMNNFTNSFNNTITSTKSTMVSSPSSSGSGGGSSGGGFGGGGGGSW